MADDTLKSILVATVSGGMGGLTLGGIMIWLVRKLATEMVWQNRKMVESALEQGRANTDAINMMKGAVEGVGHGVMAAMKESVVVRDERDKALFKQLDRIEGTIERRYTS